MTDLGDTPINIREYQFTLAEAATLTGVIEKNIRNWGPSGRGLLNIGQKHYLGRWLFNFLDLVRLAVMHDLTQLSLTAGDAVHVAEDVARLALEMSERDPETGKLLDDADGTQSNVNIVIAFKDGHAVAARANIRTPGTYYPPHYTDENNAPLRRTHIVVPAYSIVSDLLVRVSDLIEKRRQEKRAGDPLTQQD